VGLPNETYNSTDIGERESQPFREEPQIDSHLYFNQHYSSALGHFWTMYSALPLVRLSTATGQEP